MKTGSLFAVLSLCLATGFCQMPSRVSPAGQPAAGDLYAKENAVIDRLVRTYTYAADGTGVRDVTNAVELKTAAAVKAFSIVEVSFASSSEHVEIDYVRVRHPDGTMVATPASDAQEQPAAVTREAPFYSDLKQLQIPVRNLHEGDRVEYHLRILRTKAEAPGHFWGQEAFFTPSSQIVVLSEVVELHVPKGGYVQVWSPSYKPVTTETATESVYRWEGSQRKPVAGKTGNELLRQDPEAQHVDDHGDRIAPIAWTNFRTWAEVGAWYRALEGARVQPDDDVRAKAAALTASKVTAQAKARAIYGFVGPQIRYIGVAFGVGRYQPHEAGDVLRNQYGDCKDKHTLLAAMLAAENIPSDAVLIGSGVAFNPSVPSPGAFNHAITLAHIDGQPVWLDATAEVAPYRMLLLPLRGKQVLVIPDDGPAHLDITPQAPPFPLVEQFDAEGSLDDQGTSHSHFALDLRSDAEVIFRSAAHSVSPAQWDQLMQQISYGMSYAGKTSNAQFSSPTDLTSPLHITWDYEREKSGDWPSLRILPQFPPAGAPAVDEKEPPVLPIEMGSLHVETAHTVMKLPPGWGVELPAAVHETSAYASMDKTYKFENGALIADRRLEVLVNRVPASEWQAYQRWYKAAGLDGETFVQLTRTGGSRQVAPYNEEAAALIEEAGELAQKSAWTAAHAKLDEARVLNPHQASLWSSYGYIAERTGKLGEAADACRREIEEHPEEQKAYLMLSYVQMTQKHPEEAMETLRKLLAQHPDESIGVIQLARLQEAKKDTDGAESTLRNGLAASPDDTLKLELATLQLREGKREAAHALLSDMATGSKKPLTINNAAYTLADESLDPSLSLTAAKRALSLLDEEVRDHTGSEKDALSRASLQVDLWDTLGWALYRQKQVTEAEPWIRAAWEHGQSPEVGLHLGQVLEAQGKLDESMRTYLLALHTNPNTERSLNRKLLTPDAADSVLARTAKLLALKIYALQDKGVQLPQEGTYLTRVLQDRRTYPVPRPAATPAALETVSFLITPAGKVEDIRVVSGDQKLDPVVRRIATIPFHLSMPPDAQTPLLREAVLSCYLDSGCQLILILPPDAAANTQ